MQIIADTFEGKDRTPVVRHVFYGKTEREARSIMRAHLKTDRFLRGCLKAQRYGAISCHVQLRKGQGSSC